ncbi:MAG: FAD-dependent oxidoreductase [Novosphingobium sp.]|nr:FAD-dependent oxidoreductase [Novosphingobium sp.]
MASGIHPLRVVLAGGGHAHLAVLADWAAADLPGTERVLVTRDRFLAYSGMLPGWMAGRFRADELLIDLAPLAEAAGARLALDDVIGLDAAARQLQLASGETLAFDLLSLATGGIIATSAFVPLGPRVLPVRPVEQFMAGWEAFCAAGPGRTVAVVGGGASGVELALAAARRGHHVHLVSPAGGFMPGHGARARGLAQAALGRAGVAIHAATARRAPEGLALDDGTVLPVDLAILATGSAPPGWLVQSGLARDPAGFVRTGADLRSTSHSAIFAAGDIAARADRALPRAGVHAVKAGPMLAANLRAALTGQPLRAYQPGSRRLALLATGDGRAIASWGSLGAEGRWLSRVKDRIDRSFIARYTRRL